MQKNKQWFVRIPYYLKDIKEVTISCELPAQCRTKKFFGEKSGDDSMTIFGRIERCDVEKKAIKNEKGFEQADEMVRHII